VLQVHNLINIVFVFSYFIQNFLIQNNFLLLVKLATLMDAKVDPDLDIVNVMSKEERGMKRGVGRNGFLSQKQNVQLLRFEVGTS